MAEDSTPISSQAEVELQNRLIKLLEDSPLLRDHIGQPGWAAYFCLLYWARYEGLLFALSHRKSTLTSPETILRQLRKLRLSPQTKTSESPGSQPASGPLDLYLSEQGE